MARPKKKGMEWFPCETEFNKNFRALEELHENDGFTWLVKFWQEAYKTEDGIVDLSGIHGVIVAKTARVSYEKQAEIIRDCLLIGLLKQIEPEKYTSNGIIKRHIRVIKKREYDRNRAKNELSLRKQHDNDVKSTQSRVEKSRVENNKNKKETQSSNPIKTKSLHKIIIDRFYAGYEKQRGVKYVGLEMDLKPLAEFLKNNPGITEEDFFEVVDKCVHDPFHKNNLTIRHICKFFAPIRDREQQ